jgi:uncharacterized protein (TIGR02246 family)
VRTRLSWWLALPAFVLGLFALSGLAGSQGDSKDIDAIQKRGETFVETFHKGDAKALAGFWTADGDYTSQTGLHLKGREAIEKAFEAFFAENKGVKLRINSDSLRFVTPDVAIEDGTTEVFSVDGGPPNRSRYSNVHVKKDGQWLLSSVHDSAFTPPSNEEKLNGLAWTVGDWASNGDKGNVERLSVAWAENETFLIAAFSTTFGNDTLGSATQWIGWDPNEKRVRSWIFDGAGGFGEGAWTRDGKQWTIKTSSIREDGKKATATYVVTQVDANNLTLQAKDRTEDGNALPDGPGIQLKRVN